MDGSTAIDTSLRSLVDRICSKYDDRDETNGDIRELYAEAKEAGFVVAMVRQMVKEQRLDAEARHAKYEQEQEYRGKLGLFADTPLGEATVRREAEAATPPEYPKSRYAEKPTPFAEQPVHEPRKRGRPPKPKTAEDALAAARAHFSQGEPDVGQPKHTIISPNDGDPLWGPRH